MPNENLGAVIQRVGARGSVGFDALQLAMGVRAQKLSPVTLPWRDKRGRRMGACVAGRLSLELTGHDRLVALAAPALREALAGAGREPLPLYLALPEAGRADDDERLSGAILGTLAERAGATIDLERSRVFRAGQAGGALAVQAALGEVSGDVLVGGVDSHIHRSLLASLDEECRLHAEDAEDGFIPGEAAAFVRLSTGRRAHAGALARVSAALTAMEPTVESGEPNGAEGLTRVVHELVEGVAPAAWVLSDLNGERCRTREWALVQLRAPLAEGLHHDRVPEQLGDVGAASAAVMMAVATIWWVVGCAPSERALAVVQSEGGLRGGLVLEAA